MNDKLNVEHQTKIYDLRSLTKLWGHFSNPCSIFDIRYSTLIILSFLIFPSCSAKTTPPPTDTSAYELIKKIDIQAKWMATDKLQQLYLITTENEVIKYSPEGTELFRFSNNTLGDLTHIDITNPFSVLLYYPDFLTIYTLDRTLNKTGEFSLFDLNLTNVETVGMSNDNNVWLYDFVFYRIKKINRKGEVLRESIINLSNEFESPLQPNFILERENWLYVNDPNLGILVFDIYAQYQKTIDIKNLTHFQIIDNQLIYKEKEQLKSFHLKSLATQIIDLPEGISLENQIAIQKSKLFVRKKKGVEVYSF